MPAPARFLLIFCKVYFTTPHNIQKPNLSQIPPVAHFVIQCAYSASRPTLFSLVHLHFPLSRPLASLVRLHALTGRRARAFSIAFGAPLRRLVGFYFPRKAPLNSLLRCIGLFAPLFMIQTVDPKSLFQLSMIYTVLYLFKTIA